MSVSSSNALSLTSSWTRLPSLGLVHRQRVVKRSELDSSDQVLRHSHDSALVLRCRPRHGSRCLLRAELQVWSIQAQVVASRCVCTLYDLISSLSFQFKLTEILVHVFAWRADWSIFARQVLLDQRHCMPLISDIPFAAQVIPNFLLR